METSPLEISPDGELAIHSSHDGVIKVWETITSSLKNEYKPSSHLSTTCSCLSWCQRSKTPVSKVRVTAWPAGGHVFRRPCMYKVCNIYANVALI